jgi:hypothetical protein
MSVAFLASPLVARLLALRLPPDDYAVFGSGPMLAHDLKADVGDLDVLARGPAWAMAVTLGEPTPAPSGSGLMVELDGGSLQIFSAWTSADWDVDRLIDGAELIGGIRFVPLPLVLAWKRQSGRPKDLADIKLIEAHLG